MTALERDTHLAIPASDSLGLLIAGMPLRVDGVDDELRPGLHDLLRPFIAGGRSPAPVATVRVAQRAEPPGWVLTHDGHELFTSADPERVLAFLDWWVTAQALEATSTVAVFHAAALTRGEATVLLLAQSGAGKTTLTLGLMQRGWEPLTDDIVLVDRESLGISPFPRCFHVDEATSALLDTPSLVEQTGGAPGYARPARWAAGGVRPTCIAVAERCATCPSSRWPILQAEAAAGLITAALRNQVPRAEVVRIAARLAAEARSCVRLRNGHLDGALNLIEGAAQL